MDDFAARNAAKMAELAAAEAVAVERAAKARARANAARQAIASAEEKSRAVAAAAAESKRQREIASQENETSSGIDKPIVDSKVILKPPSPTTNDTQSAPVIAAHCEAEGGAGHVEPVQRSHTLDFSVLVDEEYAAAKINKLYEAECSTKVEEEASEATSTNQSKEITRAIEECPSKLQPVELDDILKAVVASHRVEDLVVALKRAGICTRAQLSKAGDALLTGPAVGLKREELDAIRSALSHSPRPSLILPCYSAPVLPDVAERQANEEGQNAVDYREQIPTHSSDTAPLPSKERKKQAAERARRAAEEAASSQPRQDEVIHLTQKERKKQAAERALKAKESSSDKLAAEATSFGTPVSNKSLAEDHEKSSNASIFDVKDMPSDGSGSASHSENISNGAVSTPQKLKDLGEMNSESRAGTHSSQVENASFGADKRSTGSSDSSVDSAPDIPESPSGLATVPESEASDESDEDLDYEVGETVDVKDETDDEWEPGTVVTLNGDGAVLVRKSNYVKAFSWKYLRRTLVESECNKSAQAEEAANISNVSVSNVSKKIEIGDEVEVRDDSGDEWEPGIVQDVNSEGEAQVLKKGYDKAYSWEHVRRSLVREQICQTNSEKGSPTKMKVIYEVGDQVDAKDEVEEDWEPGVVASLNEYGEPQVLKEGYEKAFLFERVRLSPAVSNRKGVVTQPPVETTERAPESIQNSFEGTSPSNISTSDLKVSEASEFGGLEHMKDEVSEEKDTEEADDDIKNEESQDVLDESHSKLSLEKVDRSIPNPMSRETTTGFDGTEEEIYRAPTAEEVLMEGSVPVSGPSGTEQSMEVLSTWSELTDSEDDGIVTPLNVALKLEGAKKDEPEVKNRYAVIQTDHVGKGGDAMILAREKLKANNALVECEAEQRPKKSTHGGYERVNSGPAADEEDQSPEEGRTSKFTDSEAEDEAYNKVMWAIMPPILLLSFFSYIDRCNLAFVSEDLQQHVGLTDSQYGMGAGVFFVGYCLFQVPSQMVLVRIGERNWLGFMAFAWGIACCAMAACTDVESFYRARFALGVAEAGFFPGAMSFLRLFLPKNQFGFAYGMIVASMCTAMVCGGPLAASVMELTGDGEPGGLAGWQWLFLAQGLPAVALGLSLFCWLPAKPVDIDFGSSEKAVEVKRAYLQKLQDESFAAKASSAGRDGAADKKAGCVTLRRLCGDTRMWAFATCFFFHSFGFWGLVFWVPRVVGAVLADSEADPEHLTSIMGSSTNATISLVAEELADIRHVDEAEPVETVSVLVLCLSAVPYLGAVAGSLLNSWHSDRTGERRWHLICSLLLGSFGLFLTASTLHQPKANMISLTLTAFGLYACSPPFWGFVNELTPDDQDAAIMTPMINSFGSLGGLVGPVVVGLIHEHLGSYRPVLLFFAWTELMASVPLFFCLSTRRASGTQKL